MTIRLIEHGGPDYLQMLDLRLSTLLEPVGIPASYIDRDAERSDLLIGAFEDALMVGCCVLSPRGNGRLQLRQMAVSATIQGKGIGAAILRFAEQTAKTHGFTEIFLHARNAVIGFYERSGYTIDGEEFFEVGIGHHKMQKQL